MALWLCRAGKLGEYETKFIEDTRIYCTWSDTDWDMSAFAEKDAFRQKLQDTYPDTKENTIRNWTGQLWAFSHSMQIGDWVLVPSKIQPIIYVGKIKSPYRFDANAEPPYWHYRDVEWIRELPRSDLDQDLLYSIGAFMTVCKINRNNAEKRIHAIVEGKTTVHGTQPEEEAESVSIDLEENALQEIADQLIRKCKGHELARVVAAILEAKGFTTYLSPAGPDKGVDILASQGALGFGSPSICVQVKSGADPIDRPTLDQLIGTMSNHKAEYGLLVSWGGFKSSVLREQANHFFKVRLWTHKDILQEFLRHYESLPEDIREMIPLKRIWIIDRRVD